MTQEGFQPGLPPQGLRATPRPLPGQDIPLHRSDGGLSTLIPYTNPKALTAYYCGVFALIPCAGLVLGPVALVFGILGLQYVKTNPTVKGTAHAIVGIVLGTLTALANVVAALILIAMFLAKR